MRERMSGGGARGPHKPGWCAQGGCPRPKRLWPTRAAPRQALCLRIFQKFQKNHTRFSGRMENFYFRGTFLPDAKTENKEN